MAATQVNTPAGADAPVAPPDTTDGQLTPGRSKWSKRRATAFLASCPKRTVMIERTNDDIKVETDTGKPVGQPVIWNGWMVTIPKGRPVPVPEPIAAILDNQREIFRTAQARERRAFLIDIGDTLGVQLTDL